VNQLNLLKAFAAVLSAANVPDVCLPVKSVLKRLRPFLTQARHAQSTLKATNQNADEKSEKNGKKNWFTTFAM
jgi:hypothetical protein